jgi:NAD(P)H-flavin reductase
MVTLSEPEPALLADPMVPDIYTVSRSRRETADTKTLELQPTRGAKPFEFHPGQFNMLYVFGVGEVPISLSGDTSSPVPIIHTIRDVGAVSRGLCNLKRGDAVGLRGPFGSSWPVEDAEGADVLVIAGGIGLAPLRPAIHHLISRRRRYGRVAILYGARSPAELLYRREVERWRGRFDLEVHATVDHAADSWMGRVGVVTRLIRLVDFDPDSTVAMVCGPEIMMRFTIRELQDRGVPEENVFLSMERNMKCAVGFCGHCQFGPVFVCRDGPIFRYDRVRGLLGLKEI